MKILKNNYDPNDSSKMVSHTVELSEKDLYMLGFILEQFKWDYEDPKQHTKEVLEYIRQMQADY